LIKARLLIVCDVNLLKCVARSQYGNGVFAEAGAAVVSSEECAEESRRKGPRDVANQAKGRTPEARDSKQSPIRT